MAISGQPCDKIEPIISPSCGYEPWATILRKKLPMKNRKTLMFAGIALLGLGLCACAAIAMLMFRADSDAETVERVAEATAVVETLATETESQAEATNAESELEAPADTASEPTAEIASPAEEPTDAPEPTSVPEPTPTPQLEPGMSRSNPLTIADVIEAPNWTLEVLEAVRGDEAWGLLQTTNQFNEPPPTGMQYVLVRLKATSTYADAESHLISQSDFGLTGDRLILYDYASVVVPEPELNAELFTGGETEGWLGFMAGADEGQLMLVIDELLSFDDDRYRFVALDEAASVGVDPTLFDVDPTDSGSTRANPVPPGSPATTDDWEITISEVVRGEEAWAAVQSANQFNEPPAEGMEYVAVKLLVRNISTNDRPVNIDGSSFELTGERNVLYNRPSVVDPEPALDVDLYPGGQYEGWTIMTAGMGEEQLLVRFEPFFEFSSDNVRYLALAEGASLTVPTDLADIEPNGLGEDRTSPVPLGQTAITDDWEFTVLEVVRGNEALVLVQEANQFNEAPEPGTEYVAVRVKARNISSDDEPVQISDSFFTLVDESNVEYDLPSIVEPEPALDISLYPGGEYEGWVVLQASEGSTNPIAIVASFLDLDQLYLSLVP